MESWRQKREGWLLLAPALIILASSPSHRFPDGLAQLHRQGNHVEGPGCPFHRLENYAWTLTDPDFLDAIWRTLYFTGTSVALETVVAIAVALLLNLDFRGRNVLRTLIILPWAVPTIVNAMMWRLIFHPEYGALNALLTQIGLLDSYRSWLGEPASAMNMIVLADAWKNYPLIAFVVLAALQTIRRSSMTPRRWMAPTRGSGSGM